ncbi:MAG: TIR domain-containing protein [Verrucomicrobiae bacterium]|nr:TIR domain-containing protein [Verrucomicrobiae bacterium]
MPDPTRGGYDAFLAFDRADQAVVESVRNWLTEPGGLGVFLDYGELDPGALRRGDRAAALRRSRCLVVMVGPQSAARWGGETAQAFMAAGMRENELTLIPVILPGVTAEQQQGLPMSFQRRLWIPFPRDARDVPALQALAAAIRKAGDVTGGAPDSVPGVLDAAACPYRGLRGYREEDAYRFFGREHAVQRVLLRLSGSSVVTLAGPARVGKTSVVRAGVLPELRAQGWATEVMTPGPDPLDRLARVLWGLQRENLRWRMGEIREHLREAGLPILGVLADQILDDLRKDRLLLVIDQFEELFVATRDDGVRRRFMALLAAAAGTPGGRVRMLVVPRTAALAACAADTEWNRWITGDLLQLGVLSARDARRAIEGPAHQVGLEMEEGLTDRILEDWRMEGMEVALLGQCMEELYRRREDRGGRLALTLEAYRAMGSLGGAVATRGEEEYRRIESRFGADGTRLLRQLLAVHFVRPEPLMEELCRPVLESELEQLGADRSLLEGVLEEWEEARLLLATRFPALASDRTRGREGGDEEGEGPACNRLQVAHEIWVTRWPRLKGWLEEDRDDARAMEALRREEVAWREAGCPGDRLPAGGRLLDLEELLVRHAAVVPPGVREYVAAAVGVREEAERGLVGNLRRELREATARAEGLESDLREAEGRLSEATTRRKEAEDRFREQAKRWEEAEASLGRWRLACLLLGAVGVGLWLAWRGGYFG